MAESAGSPTARGESGQFSDGPRVGDMFFPLRQIEVPAISGTGRARRRTRRFVARVKEVNATISGLDFLAGYGEASGTADAHCLDGPHHDNANTGGEPFEPQSSYNSLQAAVISDIRDLVEELPEVPSSGMEASFRETLRGRAGYPSNTAQGAFAQYQPTALSAPSDTSAAPYAMMRPVEQTDILDSLHGPIVPSSTLC